MSSSDFQAQSFVTGDHADGYTVDTIEMKTGAPGSQTTVTIREDSSGSPGNVVATLTNPPAWTTDGLSTFTAPAGTTLNARRTYWVSVNEGTSTSDALAFHIVPGNTDTGASGWSMADTRLFRTDEGNSWNASANSLIMAVTGAAILSDDATLSALALTERSTTTAVELAPAFAADTAGYRAWVGNEVSYVTVRATKSHAGARVAIAGDRFTGTPDVAVLDLEPGRNTVRVTVTAADGSTQRTTRRWWCARPGRRRATRWRSSPPT